VADPTWSNRQLTPPIKQWPRLKTRVIAPLILSGMIWRTLQIPHTMAATGLFYMALLGVFVGEILGAKEA